ncbi:uncharacterized protein [Rutidosis leptorrhynchoides]|uniref:uncharacterized protein n=1 Tax=Rutidosis leptorrhynchoides TaxID=125765 RepID=UPI003A99C8D3
MEKRKIKGNAGLFLCFMLTSKNKSRQSIICKPSSFYLCTCFPFYVAVIVVMFVITAATISSGSNNETDHQALLSFRSLISNPYGRLSSWNDSFDYCDWSGVTCGKRHKRVTSIILESRGLQGSLSPHVGNLTFLREFSLFNNSVQGPVPPELTHLFKLRILNLGHNGFSGVILTNLSGFYNLEELRLGYNNLVGSIPKEISFLPKLTVLVVEDNKLTGGLPPSLGNVTSLKETSLAPFITSPSFFFYAMSFNNLTGSHPLEIGSMLPNLETIKLNDNQLDGLVPPSLSNCSNLGILTMGHNNFSGMLSVDFRKLTNITRIMLRGNNFHGHGDADDMKFFDSLKNCSKLNTLNLSNCSLQGVLPRLIGNLSDQLQFIYLVGNQLYGNLPSSIGNLIGLNAFYLEGNHFTGKIPDTIGVLQKVQEIDLSDNKFSGPLLDAIANLSMLVKLILYSNMLEGDIPSSLGNCHSLLELRLFNNKLSGKIPTELLQLPSLSITLDLSHNQLFGSILIEVGDLKMLDNMDLSFNNLSGSIPNGLGGCIGLTFLSLRGNVLQGSVPSSLTSLKGLEALDILQNNLSGQIKQFSEQLSLKFLNLSFNDFEGEVPTTGVFANASEFSLEGNIKLCGGLTRLGLSKCKEMKKHEKKISQPSQSSTNERFMKVSYNQLHNATNGFSEANLIGRGGFSYKGIRNVVDNRVLVAVKVLSLQNRRALRSFTRECEAWRNIRHRNLLKIITSCSSVDLQGNDFKALVYEFMPNGSLQDWLHSNAHTSRLSLIQRLNILMDIASALDYLHNRCQTTIIHGDIKASNIILDEDMVAHIGDFGLARILGADTNQNISTNIKGTIGYAPPEYGLGSEMTRSGDVYSFGILLLHVMTGKKPTKDIFNDGLSLHEFAYTALQNHEIIYIIDDDVIESQSNEPNTQNLEECLALIIKIVVSCSVSSPSQRINMEHVVYELRHIKDSLQNVELII